MFFVGWAGLTRTLVVGVLAYVTLVLLLRVSGKRTLSKMNAFDFVVTVALGSTLASILLSRDVPLADGLTAFVLLVSLQFVGTWASVRSSRISRILKSQPSLLLYQGVFLDGAMRRERVTRSEVHAAIRASGTDRIDEIAAVVLESDGTVTVLKGSGTTTTSSALLQDVSTSS